MLLVERIVARTDESIETAGVVRSAWPTYQDGYVRTLLLIEFLAQSIAALDGAKAREKGGEAKGGLLVGIREARLHLPRLAVGTALRAHARSTHSADRYGAFSGTVCDVDGVEWLSASLQALRF
jgi:predicted hotdog family 3-hydroxylacyl-ACP dehydratase